MYDGVMKYDLSDTKLTILAGRYGYLVQVSDILDIRSSQTFLIGKSQEVFS